MKGVVGFVRAKVAGGFAEAVGLTLLVARIRHYRCVALISFRMKLVAFRLQETTGPVDTFLSVPSLWTIEP